MIGFLVSLYVIWLFFGYYDINIQYTEYKELIVFYTYKRKRHYRILFRFWL